MTIDKKNVLDELYILKNGLGDSAEKSAEDSESADNALDRTFYKGKAEGLQKAWAVVDMTIRNIVDLSA